MSQRFLAGWGETDLAPAKRVRLAGQFAERISDSVETPVQAVSLALESENGAVVFCGCDLESVSLNLLALVRERLSALVPDLDPRCVILSATHSHTSLQYTGKNVEGRGSLSVLQNYLPDDVRYESAVSEDEDVMSDNEALYWLADRISESVAEAWRNRAAASVSNQFGRAAVGMCRRAVYNDGTARQTSCLWRAAAIPAWSFSTSSTEKGSSPAWPPISPAPPRPCSTGPSSPRISGAKRGSWCGRLWAKT